jgi:hypothetical protein
VTITPVDLGLTRRSRPPCRRPGPARLWSSTTVATLTDGGGSTGGLARPGPLVEPLRVGRDRHRHIAAGGALLSDVANRLPSGSGGASRAGGRY